MSATLETPTEIAESQGEWRADDTAAAFSKIMEKEPDPESPMRDKTVLVVGGPEVEGQQLEIVDARDQGRVEVYFKLTEPFIKELQQTMGEDGEAGELTFTEKGSGRTIWIDQATPATRVVEVNEGTRAQFIVPGEAGNELEALKGLVRIDIAAEDTDEYTLAKNLQTALEQLGLGHVLERPQEEGLKEYKAARLQWLHKLDASGLEGASETIDHMVKKEVAPGYVTIIDPDRHLDYEEHWGRQVVTHRLPLDRIAGVIEQGGLYSTLERFKRGLDVTGRSSIADLASGGADSVFAYCHPEVKRAAAGQQASLAHEKAWLDGPTLIIDSSILDRTDMYMFSGGDAYGSTSKEKFDERKRPEEFFPFSRKGTHELDFRTAIGLADINAIACEDEAQRQEVIASLTEAGIHEVNGLPLDQFVVVPELFSETVELAHRRPANR